MTLQFIRRGVVMTADELVAATPKTPRVSSPRAKVVDSRDDATESHGFLVTGYPPERWAQIPADYAFERARFDKGERRSPGTQDEFMREWRRTHKPGRVRSKPYELEQAAARCAEMATRAGWMEVVVKEVLRG